MFCAKVWVRMGSSLEWEGGEARRRCRLSRKWGCQRPCRPAPCASCKSKTHLGGYYAQSCPPCPHLPPSVYPTLPYPPTTTPLSLLRLASLDKQLASLDAGACPAPPLNNKTPTVATHRLGCALPCVCTALCVESQTFSSPPPPPPRHRACKGVDVVEMSKGWVKVGESG